MLRFLRTFLGLIALAFVSAVAIALYRSPDPAYSVEEWLNSSRFHRYDALIETLAAKHGVDPMLVKAVIWRESKFQADKIGKDGERGLMQVGELAAKEWVKSQKIESFVMADLFDPKTNIDAGTWYLNQSIQRWSKKDDPVTFALAEYNAGRGRVSHWLEDSNVGKVATAADLRDSISFPGTTKYIDSILSRWEFYKKRGRL
jgi:peptidoglycan lytic transglycosylase